ncbi:hypothetical protein [Actinomycetospora callitridis]|uniref:hypothetical protein n=1 Tax=Actinomycetospora callitridis TaxID=913944 RepID=UPI0023664D64|nr:hypothetical protein [Actinomycetospora callitridis]MDD7921720.1 hypothetical protein [Actinomycetospora callitridis]
MFSALGLTTMRGCVIGWVISAVLLVVGLVFTFTPHPVIGIVIFAVGVVGIVLVTLAVLRVRKGHAG